MALEVGARLLRGRYELLTGPSRNGGDAVSWEAFSEYGVRYLIKTWLYEGDEPDPVQRALWDAELRTLYKVGSSPGADDTLVVLRDAGLDRESRCFVMVLDAPGYEPLASALARRGQYDWLSNRDVASRRELWRALLRIASGLQLLHERQVLHRDVGVDALVFSDEEGVESLRLAGSSGRFASARRSAPIPRRDGRRRRSAPRSPRPRGGRTTTGSGSACSAPGSCSTWSAMGPTRPSCATSGCWAR